jgi:phosphoribosylformimino-5-aminoimidazole carboxamide ribotide isomerase
MEIIPAIDLIDGKCVRLTEGDYERKTVYHEDPLAMAKTFEAAGLRRLHLVDLDGAKAGKVVNWKVLEDIAKGTGLSVDFGGGVKTEDDVRRILDAGADMVTVGSIAVRDETRLVGWFERHGPERFLLGADVREGMIAIGAWTETTGIGWKDFLRRYLSHGVTQVFCTDVSRDGRLEGPSLGLYRAMRDTFPDLALIASGGVASMDDLHALKDIGCSGAIVGKAIYEGRMRLDELAFFNP